MMKIRIFVYDILLFRLIGACSTRVYIYPRQKKMNPCWCWFFLNSGFSWFSLQGKPCLKITS